MNVYKLYNYVAASLIFVCMFGMSNSSKAQVPLAIEQTAMENLLTSGGNFPASWVVGNPIQTWAGVTTIIMGPNYIITAIEIPGQNAVGAFPANFLDDLGSLQTLNVEDNALDADPFWITSAHNNLQTVRASNNNFTDFQAVVNLFGNATVLNDAILAYVMANTAPIYTLPVAFGSGSVQFMSIEGNNLTGNFNLDNFFNVDVVNISNNQLTDILPPSGTQGPIELDCSQNNLFNAGGLQIYLQNCVNLERLFARNAFDGTTRPFSGTGGIVNTGQTGLGTTFTECIIDLGENNFSGTADIRPFGSQVQTLLIDHNNINYLAFGGPQDNIEYFDASFNVIQLGIELFKDLPSIKVLKYNDNGMMGKLPDPTMASLPYYVMPMLEELDLSNNNIVGELHLTWILQSQIDTVNNGGFGSMFIEKLAFSNNNFSDFKVPTTAPPSDSLAVLNVDGNKFDFGDLYQLVPLFNMTRQNINGSFYQHYAPAAAGTDSLAFLHHPQKAVGIGGVKRRRLGQDVRFYVDISEPPSIAGAYNQYEWKRVDLSFTTTEPVSEVNYDGSTVTGTITSVNGTVSSSLVLPSSTATNDEREDLIMESVDTTHGDWYYELCATNEHFPLLEVCNQRKKMIVGECYDSSGQVIECQQIMVEIDTSYSSSHLDSIADVIGVRRIDSCLCGAIELWELHDTTNMIDVEFFGFGTRSTATQADSRTELLSADVNRELLDDALLTADTNPSNPSGSSVSSPTLVAIIDSGTDIDHPSLDNRIWINAADNSMNGIDDDGNCATDDGFGFNFIDDTTSIPYDDHGHGTQVAGIIAGIPVNAVQQNLTATDNLALMPIKYTNQKGQGSCFNAACAIRYATDYMSATGDKVRVINASWGYYGDPNQTLKNQLIYAGDNCDMLVVTSSGNDGLDNDANEHYPSNYDLDNIIVVGAQDALNQDQLAVYSNFGANMVDILADGEFTTTDPSIGNSNTTTLVFGTSYATAQVSRAAGLLFHQYPNASFRAVKTAIMNSSDVLNSADSSKIKSKGRLNYANALTELSNNTNRTVCAPSISINIRLEGPIDTTLANGYMRRTLLNNNLVPSTQPYNRPPWNYSGTESVNFADPAFSGPANSIVDWVLVELEGTDTSYVRALILQRDGDIVDTDGLNWELPDLVGENFKVMVMHRNHLALSTLNAAAIDYPLATYNFSDTASTVITTNSTKVQAAWNVMISGDPSGDGQINAVDKNAFIRPQAGPGLFYRDADLNMDGRVNNFDFDLWRLNNSLETNCTGCYNQAQ